MTTIDPAKPKLPKSALSKITLAHGSHPDRSNGLCVMEVAAWLAGRKHSDHPPCVSNVIGSFLRSWNDSLDDMDRQMLKPYAWKVLNTATSKADEETRAWLATDWLVREYAPAWLRLAGLTEQAESLERLAALDSPTTARAAQPILTAARMDLAAAWAAARAAAGDAAWDAAWDAARDAAWAAARDAARDAAGDAARAAAWAAAGDAAWDALQPTTRGLQKSALLLLDRMIAVGKGAA